VQAALTRAHDSVIVDSYLADQTKPADGYPSEDDIKAAYQQDQGRLMQPRRYHLIQILIAVPAGADADTDAAARNQTKALRAQALQPGADFAALAATASTDKAVAAARGDMGWVPEDQLLPQVKSAVAGLAVGGISEPVRTAGGWHLLELAGTTPAGPASFAEVHDQLAQLLRQQRAQQNARAYLAKMMKEQPIQLNAIAIGAVLGSGS
jgi:peptidylprolyl isomerase